MIRNIAAGIALIWSLGFMWFAGALPQPADDTKTQAVIVPTGGAGRIAQGLSALEEGLAPQMLVSGVDPEVKPAEFAAEFGVSEQQMQCCITLGFMAEDTHENAIESAMWAKEQGLTSLRLVTSDWHIRRAASELERELPDDVSIIRDAVPSQPSFWILFLEYHKFIASPFVARFE